MRLLVGLLMARYREFLMLLVLSAFSLTAAVLLGLMAVPR